ncbi:MAG: gliding motility-associated C-terminal domain-containing protein [Flavobacteriales bacterium]|nr:gliding motility-associated C-terminal domain-containing protein [Flavobacteriales bacterium]
MKTLLALLFSVSLLHFSFGQTTSDCEGAIPVCEGFYEETTAPFSTGSVTEIPFTSCNTGEFNSVWYVFTVQEDGLLSFILDPADDISDYDWGLYDISSNGCDGISSGASPEVSCNSWGVLGVNGPTGISTDNGGTGNSNGPGDLLGPPFNADLSVTAGTTFALAVMNWSGSLDGYSLNFAESTASIFDDIPPSITSVVPDCSGSELIITFSENVVIESIQLDDFSITGPGGSYTVASFEAEGGVNVSMDDVFTITLGNPITESGSYELILEEFADFVQDPCGNTATGSFTFEISGLMSFDYVISAACNGGAGEIELIDITGGIEPYSFSLNNVLQTGNVFDDLNPGNYSITMEDNQGCELTQNVVVENFMLSVNAGPDSVLCAMNFFLEGSYNAGNFSWETPVGIVVNEVADAESFVTANAPGVYTLIAVAHLNDCQVSDVVELTFSYPLNQETQTTDASCHGFCDGFVEIVSNSGELSANLNGITQNGENIIFDGLCDDQYLIWISDFAGCSTSEVVNIYEPPAVVANFSASPQPLELPETTIFFTNESQNDSIVHWYFGNPAFGESIDNETSFSFPQGIGGTYEVMLVATDIYGCLDSISSFIIIEDNFSVFAPNAFTPDGDGVNDIFQVEFSYAPLEYELYIFNRWGEPIFVSTNYNEAWTGNVYRGNYFAQNGVYQWLLKVRGNEPNVRTLSGTVVLFR